MATEGLVTVEGRFDVTLTVEKLEKAIEAGGQTVFARIDHSEGARIAGFGLRPTFLLIFGNAKAGTPLMSDTRTIGVDLP